MKPVSIPLVLLFAAANGMCGDEPGVRHFIDRVKPLLESRCVSCHGPDKVKSGVRLVSGEAALTGGKSGLAPVPGNPSQTLLLQAVMHPKKDLEMPPKKKLTTNDIPVLEPWILDGAPWPKSEPLPPA